MEIIQVIKDNNEYGPRHFKSSHNDWLLADVSESSQSLRFILSPRLS